jgi:hypothetical protein
MPIKDATIYPPYWKQFSLFIRTERSGGECEVCSIPNGWVKVTYKRGFEGVRDFIGPTTEGLLFEGDRVIKLAKVVLTVAHLDAVGDVCRCQDRTGFLCANPAHVKAMCQKCHNTYDRPKRNRNAAATRKDAARGLFT